MKKVIFLLLSFIILSNYFIFAQFGGGNGTVDDPYQIKTKAHLEELADSVNYVNNWSKNKYFILMNDITDTVRTVIGHINGGDEVSDDRGFNGNFDGQGFKIVLGINNSIINDKPYNSFGIGLFGSTKHCTISNLTVEGYVISSVNFLVGAIAGIVNNIPQAEEYTVIKNCVNNCTVTGTCGAGGIVGFGRNCKIENCINKGTVRNNSNFIIYHGCGGIIGFVFGVQIENCINTGNVEGIYGVGGILGNHIVSNEVDKNVNIRNCINSGFVKGEENVGGIAGRIYSYLNSYATVSNCINTGTVSGNSNIGCIIGHKDGGQVTVENCFFDKQMCGE